MRRAAQAVVNVLAIWAMLLFGAVLVAEFRWRLIPAAVAAAIIAVVARRRRRGR